MSTCWAVTGATGLVGNNLIRALCKQGHRVRVLARGAGPGGAPRRELEGLPVDIVPGELSAGPLNELVRGADVVVHAAAHVWVGTSGREAMERVNVGGTEQVCRAVLACAPTARMVHVSSVDALGLGTRQSPANEDTPPRDDEGGVAYVDTKRAADKAVRGFISGGLDAVFIHPTYMIGPWDWRPSSGKMLLEIARGKGLLAPAGGNNFVDVRDVVDGIIAVAVKTTREGPAMRSPTGSAWILGNENLSYLEAWTRMSRVVGVRPPLCELPRWLGLTVAQALELPLALGLTEGEINPAAVRMGLLPHYFDPGKARRAFGLVPRPLDQAFTDAWAWFREHGF